MAETLIKETGKDVYLLTENGGLGSKNPDGFYILDTIEMKHVRGGLEKLGKNSMKALSQSDNVFLYCDKSFSKEGCIKKIKGSLFAKQNEYKQKGEVFTMPPKDALLYIYTNGELLRMNWGDVF